MLHDRVRLYLEALDITLDLIETVYEYMFDAYVDEW